MTDVLLVDQPQGQLVVAPSAVGVALTEQPVAQLVVADPSGGVQTLFASAAVASLTVAATETSVLVATQPAAQLLVGDQGSTIYGPNVNGDRAAFILPDLGRPGGFVPDPEGVNINGSKVARLIYQVRLGSDPTGFGNSRVGAWLSSNWDNLTGTPTAKASHYSWYFTAKGGLSDPDYPQEISVLVAKGVLAAGAEHGKIETRIAVAAHERVPASGDAAFAWLTEDGDAIVTEDGDTIYDESAAGIYEYVNGKLVVDQIVLQFDAPTPDIDYDPESGDDDDGAGDPGDDPEPSTPRTVYPGYGQALNNAGLSGGFAGTIVKARKPDSGGVPWMHGHYVSKRGVSGYAYRYQRYYGVTAVGFLDRTMPFLGLGTDKPLTPVHVKGDTALEHRQEYTGPGATPYRLGGFSFYGKSSLGVATYPMAEIRVDVTDPTRGTECATLTLAARQAGVELDVLHVGRGLYMDGLDDQGPGTLNLSGLFIDNVLVAGTDPDAADPVIAVSVVQHSQGIVIKSTAPDDGRFRGVRLYREDVTNAPGVLVELDDYSYRRNQKIKLLDTKEDLVAGVEYAYYEASWSKLGDTLSTVQTRIGSAVWTVDALPAGQTISLSNGATVQMGGRLDPVFVTDGDVVSFTDIGALPFVVFMTQVLPIATAGTQNVGTATGLSATGFTVSLKNVTPGTLTAQDTGAGSSDATVPHPGGAAAGFSVAKGVTANAYDGLWRVFLNLSFVIYPADPTVTGRATIRLYKKVGGVWSKITDLDFVATAAGPFTGNVVAQFNADLTLGATDLFGVSVLSLGSGTGSCVINAFNRVKWTSSTAPTVNGSATPNGEQVPVYIHFPS